MKSNFPWSEARKPVSDNHLLTHSRAFWNSSGRKSQPVGNMSSETLSERAEIWRDERGYKKVEDKQRKREGRWQTAQNSTQEK